MMMKKDEWFSSALTDDAVVVELLFRLKSSPSSSEVSMPSMPSPPFPLPPVSWGLRLPRSKLCRKDSTTTTRFSPRTPLSWSGGAAASLSDGAYDESSTSPGASSDPSRSKGTCTSEIANICSNNKGSRKKKKFSELQEEESILLNENFHLKRELASVNLTVKKQRARSKNFKRIKIDLNLQSGESGATSAEKEAVISHEYKIEATTDRSFSSSCMVDEEADAKRSCFVLPDLNMMPMDEDVDAEFV